MTLISIFTRMTLVHYPMSCVPPPVDSFTEFEGDATQALSSTVSCAILTIIGIVKVIIVALILPNITPLIINCI